MKNAVFWYFTPCGSCKNMPFIYHQSVPTSPIVTVMIEAILYCETSVLTRATRRNIPEDAFFNILATLLKCSVDDIQSEVAMGRQKPASAA
jgi:hypothetical protein